MGYWNSSHNFLFLPQVDFLQYQSRKAFYNSKQYHDKYTTVYGAYRESSKLLISRGYTDKKENKIFLIYKEIQSGAVAKSYVGAATKR